MTQILKARRHAQTALLNIPGVHSVGIGPKRSKGAYVGAVAVIAYVEKKIPHVLLKREHIIPSEIHGFPTDVIEYPRHRGLNTRQVPDLEAELPGEDTKAYLPLVGGIRITAQNGTGTGTLGLIVRGPDQKPAILSCHHVLKDSGEVFQPGRMHYAVATVSGYAPGSDLGYATLADGITWTNYVAEIGPVRAVYNLTPDDLKLPYHTRKRGAKTGLSNTLVTGYEVHGISDDGSAFGPILLVDGPMNAGDSGAVLIDDLYRVVGLLYQNYGPTEGAAYPVATIIDELKVSFILDSYPPLHMVRRGADTNDMCYENVSDGGPHDWSPSVVVHPGLPYLSAGAPALHMVRDELLCLRQGTDAEANHIWAGRFHDGNWGNDARLAPSDDPSAPYITTSAPACVEYDGKLFCVYASTYGALTYACFEDGVWSAPTEVNPADPLYSRFAPALVVWRGMLYCFVVPTTTEYEICYLTYDGKTWSAPQKPGRRYKTLDAPSLVAYRGKLYGLHSGFESPKHLFAFTYDGVTWSDDQRLAPSSAPDQYFETAGGPTALVWNDLLYCFYQSPGASGRITCATSSGVGWSDAAALAYSSDYPLGFAFLPRYRPPVTSFVEGKRINTHDTTKHHPSGCSFSKCLYVFWRSNDRDSQIYFSLSPDEGSARWSEGARINEQDSTPYSPAVCVFQPKDQSAKKLYVIWTSNDTDRQIYFCSSADGMHWPGGKRLNEHDRTPYAPAACVYNDELYVFWASDDADHQLYFSASADGENWPHGTRINEHDYLVDAPTACVFKDKLFVFWRSGSTDHRIYFSASADGRSWPNGQRINDHDRTGEAPIAAVFDERLYLFWWADDSSHHMYFSSTEDGEYWTEGRRINEIDTSSTRPSAFASNEKLYVFYVSNDDNGYICFTYGKSQA